MPELPEVETIAGWLRQGKTGQPALLGLSILNATLYWPRTLAYPDPEVFIQQVKGQTITNIGRRGKFLLFTLSPDTLLIHLRMSGDLVVKPGNSTLGAHARLELHLNGNLRLVFYDPRKFGRVWLVPDPQATLAGLGPEPLDGSLTLVEFTQRLHTHHRQLKPLLLDQSFLAGMGNIYVDEALHGARLHPRALANLLSDEQVHRLWTSIQQALQEGIQGNGASIDWVYRGGDFQNHFRVYQRTGQPCFTCGTPIERISISQRGSHFCPICQSEGNHL